MTREKWTEWFDTNSKTAPAVSRGNGAGAKTTAAGDPTAPEKAPRPRRGGTSRKAVRLVEHVVSVNSRPDGGKDTIIWIPVHLVSESNAHEHWRKRQVRAKTQHEMVKHFLRKVEKPTLPCVVTLTRISPRPLDSDNLRGAAKHARDAVAAWMGLPNDRVETVTWEYNELRGEPKTYGLDVRFRPRESKIRIEVPDTPEWREHFTEVAARLSRLDNNHCDAVTDMLNDAIKRPRGVA